MKMMLFTISILLLSGCLNYDPDNKSDNTVNQQIVTNKEKPLIFPIPDITRPDKGNFIIDKNAFIMVPEKPSKSDEFLAKLLLSDLVYKY